MIKKQIAIVAIVATMVFSGCGEDRSHPKGIDANGNPIVHKNPVAMIDINATEHDFLKEVNGTVEYDFRSTKHDSPFVIDGTRSHDMDTDGNNSVTYEWSYEEHFAVPNCADINNTGNGIVYIKLCETANQGDGNMTITLQVKDNEGETATTRKILKVK